MSNAEFFAKRLEAEIPAFTRVLRALPAERLDHRPHEKSASANQLAWQLAVEMGDLVNIFEKGHVVFDPAAPLNTSHEDIVATFEANAARAVAAAKAGGSRWEAPSKFLVGEHVAWEDPVGEMAWGFLLDMIHHRGQLSTYIRPMGGKVPSIYGPSGDSQ